MKFALLLFISLALAIVCQNNEDGLAEIEPDTASRHSRVYSYLNPFNLARSIGNKTFVCVNYTCTSSFRLRIDRIKLNATACLNLTYIPEDTGLELKFDLNRHTLYHKIISVRNPPPVCFQIPFVKEAAYICIELHELVYTNRSLNGCVNLNVGLVGIRLARFNLGCFHLEAPTASSHYFDQKFYTRPSSLMSSGDTNQSYWRSIWEAGKERVKDIGTAGVRSRIYNRLIGN